MLRGWALAHQGQAQEGIEQLCQGLMALYVSGIEIARLYFLALLAEAYGTIGQPAAGQVAGAADGSEPESAVAAPGPGCRSPRTAGTDLWLVHRGFDTADIQEAKALLEELT